MPMLDVHIPEGALDPSREAQLLQGLGTAWRSTSTRRRPHRPDRCRSWCGSMAAATCGAGQVSMTDRHSPSTRTSSLPRFNTDWAREDREELSRAMGAYWASFARDGKPSCPSRADWPRYAHPGGSFLVLDTANDGGIRAERDADSVPQIVTDLHDDPGLSDTERRSIVAEMGKWMFTRCVEADFQAALTG